MVEAGVVVFRRFVLRQPALFRLGVQRVAVPSELAHRFRGAAEGAFGCLQSRIARLVDARQLGARSVPDAICEFHALCEGLAALELRAAIPQGEAERIWRDALAALVAGWGATENPTFNPTTRRFRSRMVGLVGFRKKVMAPEIRGEGWSTARLVP